MVSGGILALPHQPWTIHLGTRNRRRRNLYPPALDFDPLLSLHLSLHKLPAVAFENMAPRNFGGNSCITSLDKNKSALADWGLDNAAPDSGGSLRWDGTLLLTRGCPHLILSSLPGLPVLDLKPRGTLDIHSDSSPCRPQIPRKLKGILKDKGKGIIIAIWKRGIRKTAERAKKRSPGPAQRAPDGSGAPGRRGAGLTEGHLS